MAVKPVETKALLLSIGVIVAVEGIAAMVMTGTGLPMGFLGAVRVLETVLILLVVCGWGHGTSALGLAHHQIFSGLKKGLIWSALFGLAAAMVAIVLVAARVSFVPLIKTPLPKATQALVWFFIVGGLIAPVAEEVFFRGIVYGFLRRWGVLAAIAGTTVLFVAAHSIGTGVPITQVVGGIVFSLAYEAEGSLMVPITIHVLGNLSLFSLAMVLP